MQLDDLNVLAAFLAVAEERSFTRAAKRVGVSRSALSHAVRGLEERIGVRLLSRTTRSVAPTDAGEQLLGRLRPALGDVASVLDHLAERRERPAGRVRLVVSPLAAAMVLAPKLGAFAHAYPDVVLDVTTTNEMRLDLVAGHFDAGIHLGEFIERDMIAVRVLADQRAVPQSGQYRVTFRTAGPEDRPAGFGLTFLMEEHAAPYLENGQLVRVLEDWCEPFAGYFLYYPSRRQQPAALSALIDTLRLDGDRGK